MQSWRECALGLVPVAMVVMGCSVGALAEPAARSDQQLLFNPATVDQTPASFDHGAPVKPAPAEKGQARKGDTSAKAPASAAPRYFDRRFPTHSSESHISAVPKQSLSEGLAASRPSVGTFSLGVQTDTGYKPRSPFNPDASEMGYDTTYDPRRHLSVPFIGLSATSILPP